MFRRLAVTLLTQRGREHSVLSRGFLWPYKWLTCTIHPRTRGLGEALAKGYFDLLRYDLDGGGGGLEAVEYFLESAREDIANMPTRATFGDDDDDCDDDDDDDDEEEEEEEEEEVEELDAEVEVNSDSIAGEEGVEEEEAADDDEEEEEEEDYDCSRKERLPTAKEAAKMLNTFDEAKLNLVSFLR